MSKARFEFYDLLVFALIAGVMDAILIWCFTSMHAPFTLSVSLILGLIAMIRWGFPGISVTLVGGLAGVVTDLAITGSLSWRWGMANTLGYLPVLLNLFWFVNDGKEKIEKKKILGVLYVVTGFLLSELGHSAFYIGSDLTLDRVLMMFVVYDLINIVIAIVIYLVAAHQKDFVTDMNEYLVRIHSNSPEGMESEEMRENDDLTGLMQINDKDEVNDISLLDGGMVSQEQLEEQEKVRKKMEGDNKPTKFDKENEALKEESNKKSKKGKKE